MQKKDTNFSSQKPNNKRYTKILREIRASFRILDELTSKEEDIKIDISNLKPKNITYKQTRKNSKIFIPRDDSDIKLYLSSDENMKIYNPGDEKVGKYSSDNDIKIYSKEKK